MYPTHYVDNVLLFVVTLSCPLPSSFRNFRQNYFDSSVNCLVLIRTIQFLSVFYHLFPWFEAIEVRILYEKRRHVSLQVLAKDNSEFEFAADGRCIYLKGDCKVDKRSIDILLMQEGRVLFGRRSTRVLID